MAVPAAAAQARNPPIRVAALALLQLDGEPVEHSATQADGLAAQLAD
jgi:hypothetical protein